MIRASLHFRLDLTDAGGDPRGGLHAHVALGVLQEQAGGGVSSLGEEFPRANLSLDVVEIANSLSAPGSYYILTCGCGFHECARVYQPIDVRHTRSRIVWHIPGGDAGYHVNATAVSFDRSAYRDEITRLAALLHSTQPTSIVCYYHNSFERVLASMKNAIDASL